MNTGEEFGHLGMITVIIPAYNEKESVTELFRQIVVEMNSIEKRWEILFVDDGSSDGTWEAIHRITKLDDRVRALRFRRNFGKAAALMAGFSRASGDFIMTM